LAIGSHVQQANDFNTRVASPRDEPILSPVRARDADFPNEAIRRHGASAFWWFRSYGVMARGLMAHGWLLSHGLGALWGYQPHFLAPDRSSALRD